MELKDTRKVLVACNAEIRAASYNRVVKADRLTGILEVYLSRALVTGFGYIWYRERK